MTMLTRRCAPTLFAMALAVVILALGGCRQAPKAADTMPPKTAGSPQAVQVTWTLAPEADAAKARAFCMKCHEGEKLDVKQMPPHPLKPAKDASAAPMDMSPTGIEAALRKALPPFASGRPVAAKPDAQPGAPVTYEIIP